MEKALEILEEIKNVDENKYYKTKTITFNEEDIEFLEEAIAELEAFKQGCEKLVIESQKLANETLDLGEIIAKQKQRIAELVATQGTRREWYQKGYNEAMKHKTCDGCKYKNDYYKKCEVCKRNYEYFDFYVAKDNA